MTSGAATSSSDALASAPPDRRRRLTYLMLFRVVLISLVLGATTLLALFGGVDPGRASSLGLYGIIGVTYLLTLVYALWLRSGRAVSELAHIQLAGDLVIATVLMHMTGGAQSAYTFFFPLTVIGAAVVASRRATAWVAVSAAALFLLTGLIGWSLRPQDVTAIELSRSLGLNMAALVGVSVLALALSGQLQLASATLAVERSAAADLLVLHSDVVRCLSSGLVTVDPGDQVLTINQVACEILGATPEAAVGAPVDTILPGLAARLGELGERASLQRAELALARGGRELVLGVSVSPLHDRSGRFRGRVVNFQDLTDLRKMEQSVRQAERLAVVGGLAAGVAHEIRNPLASISGSIELLRQMPQADEDSRALMSIVTREIDRLNRLLTDLLDYANPRSLEIEPLDLAGLVRDTIGVFAQDRGLAGVAVELASADELGPIEMAGDAAKLRQVLWNLLRNAAEAASQGGGHVQVEVVPEPSEVVVRIRDDGPGIPAEHGQRVFEPFFTTKARGTGLGLATVHTLVNDHRGTIRFDSPAAGGTCFEVRLPYTGPRPP
ncbi:MAG TPA: ATP-binding protein [Kofleriaceae bacterium]|nr:ATP-binding protein [Kofleriaceae bacterium]